MDRNPEMPHKNSAWPEWVTPELIAETRAVWQPYYTEPLTDEQAVELLVPVGVLYQILYSGEDARDDSSGSATRERDTQRE